ncbi:MAG: sigma-70 family RNA polymerase sigma factor [Gemmatimonadota bacterium]
MTSPRPTTPDGVDESALAQRARDGDVQAFEALYRLTAGRVFALCLRMARDRERARELAHDVFVRAWEKLPTFRGEAAFSTWLHRLTVNLVLERQRSERRRAAHEVSNTDRDAELGTRPEEGAMLHLVRHDEGERLDLEAAIRTLPPNARTVFVLHEVEGFRHEEIAESMGIAQGTVRAHLHRARRLLMEYLT